MPDRKEYNDMTVRRILTDHPSLHNPKTYGIRLERNTYEQVKAIGRKQGVSMQSIANNSLDNFMEAHTSSEPPAANSNEAYLQTMVTRQAEQIEQLKRNLEEQRRQTVETTIPTKDDELVHIMLNDKRIRDFAKTYESPLDGFAALMNCTKQLETNVLRVTRAQYPKHTWSKLEPQLRAAQDKLKAQNAMLKS